jgi:acetyl esterase/lipase
MLCNSAEFSPCGARERLTALLLRNAVRLAVKPVLSPHVPLPWQRWWLKRLTRLLRAGGRVTVQHDVVGGVKGEWLRSMPTTDNDDQAPAILYLHGGGYCIGSPATHRAITARLAGATRLPVFAADYRLAPECPFPAAVDDAVAAYRALAAMGRVVIAGDSAGGGLALATALAVRPLQVPPPAAIILLSPWVDLTTSELSDKASTREAVLSCAWLSACAQHYRAGSDRTAPLASPIYGALRGLPPILIQVGADELLYSDAVRTHDALVRAGVASALWHGFHLHAGMLPAANAAIERVARFISCSLAPPVLDPVR